ncbi:MAG: metallophosphoesterase [Alphaproteobacteria bacterium]|nr:metallophosphoesterase [Alphaproteobacteria bacterium]
MFFIGDVHGKYQRYKRVIEGRRDTVQLGDMGVGFFKLRRGEIVPDHNPPHERMVEGNHRFIRGNHDNLDVCTRQRQWIRDGTVEGDVVFVGGAYSIDQGVRTQGLDWWPDEELSIVELDRLIDVYGAARPRIMVTHDCPQFLEATMLEAVGSTISIPTRTRQAFDAMFEHHQPQHWVFGHWHRTLRTQWGGCTFTCLDELDGLEIA